MGLNGRTVLITGGGTGIGAGIALAMAAAGARVAVSGRREDPLKETADQSSADNRIVFRTCDVADRSSSEALVKWATSELGSVDILVNSAGLNIPKRAVAELDPADWDKLIQVNATGAYNCIHAVLPQMRDRKDGLIVNISSIAGIRASLLGGVAYSASKFAMSALGMCVGLEEKDNGIRVTNVYPGEVETPILDNRPVQVSAEHRARILQPEDVAALVVTIASLPPRAHVPEIVIKPTIQAFA
ncbi:MAG: SDR family NAD(P)-dependent oxidoreductase [Planctomycetota bacterium]|nr:MAG: SDR family NAD(P)-dependent oxidoreductase [Planctomycetota bacterium]REJ97072.1 MAG: SDR family NAD(P)-dependent oxidoreductase [Planctomycetota bacterium]REK20577.1 MAG: SDR family NAD(P)-dependent oxidoreductase [Planctomycetota bacterium]REK35098.1 MAG: SDR family NAD(P)-dependent oxidoreductase [Planctomycetota bacterium]